MDAPAYHKPAHQYGQSYGTSPGTSDETENWAGRGFEAVPPPEVLEPVDQPA